VLLALAAGALHAEEKPAPLQAEIAMTASLDDVLSPTMSDADFALWRDGFRTRAAASGISGTTLDRALPFLRFDPDVIARDRRQAEFTKAIWDYLDVAVSEDRVTGGRAAYRANADTLGAIEARYGVDAHVLTALWGLETSYGGYMGTTNTLSALATLAADTRRAAFFEGQLVAALKIVEEGEVAPEAMLGSWAGAMGHTQFMPTSYLAHAVDFTGDGRRDVWGKDPADALASAAAYLAAHGWNKGAPWGVEVTVPEGFDFTLTGVFVTKPAAAWAALGIRDTAGRIVPDHGPASILFPAGHRGAAFMIFPNFHVIETYNPADAYVIALGHLADRIAGGPRLSASWPREERTLTGEERVELQRLLVAKGYDTGGIDGRIGPKTVAAVMAFQSSQGLVPDGFASPALLSLLR
jgi:membrane-bound lytic murein transglycosylase B